MISNLTDQSLVQRLIELVKVERRTTAEILEHIKEIDRRKLYLKLGYSSLFAYLTDGIGYTPASAQRRIDAARILRAVPEAKHDLESGQLNVSRMSLMAQSLRQKKKESPEVSLSNQEKRQLLQRIKGRDVNETQKVLARVLDVKPIQYEKKRVQQDESVRIEFTLTKEQIEQINRAKELLSHKIPRAGWAELFAALTEEFVKRKDPLLKKSTRPKSKTVKSFPVIQAEEKVLQPASARQTQKTLGRNFTSESEVARNQLSRKKPMPTFAGLRAGNVKSIVAHVKLTGKRQPIPVHVRREIYQRDRCCQWRDPVTGKKCGSRFLLQLDHIRSVSAGGGNEPENLQLLCAVHNRLKFKCELEKQFDSWNARGIF